MTALQFTAHSDAASFLAVADAFLRAAEVENSMIAVPAARMLAAPQSDDTGGYFATAADGDGVVAAAFHGSSGGVLVTAGPDRAFAPIAADLAGRDRKPNSVVGPLAACEAFARAWRERTGQGRALRFHLRYFALTEIPSSPPAEGRMRVPCRDEYRLIADWQVAFIDEVGLPEDAALTRRKALQRLERGQVRVWAHGGPTSFAGYGDGAVDTARIAPVYTPPARRGRDYASALVAGLSRELFARGKRAIFLTTDVANPTSNSIYEKIGYRPVADHFHFELVRAAV
jgi:ribosomal protein S18 acetylase RimI-like enzyme